MRTMVPAMMCLPVEGSRANGESDSCCARSSMLGGISPGLAHQSSLFARLSVRRRTPRSRYGLGGGSVEADEASAQRGSDSFGAVFRVELLQDVLQVHLDRALGATDSFPDLRV